MLQPRSSAFLLQGGLNSLWRPPSNPLPPWTTTRPIAASSFASSLLSAKSLHLTFPRSRSRSTAAAVAVATVSQEPDSCDGSNGEEEAAAAAAARFFGTNSLQRRRQPPTVHRDRSSEMYRSSQPVIERKNHSSSSSPAFRKVIRDTCRGNSFGDDASASESVTAQPTDAASITEPSATNHLKAVQRQQSFTSAANSQQSQTANETSPSHIPRRSILPLLPSDLQILLAHSHHRAAVFHILSRPSLRTDEALLTLVARYIKYDTPKRLHRRLAPSLEGEGGAAEAPKLSWQLGYVGKRWRRGPKWDALHAAMLGEGRLPSLKAVEREIRRDLDADATSMDATTTAASAARGDATVSTLGTSSSFEKTSHYNRKLVQVLQRCNENEKTTRSAQSRPEREPASVADNDADGQQLRSAYDDRSSTATGTDPRSSSSRRIRGGRSNPYRTLFHILSLASRYRRTRGFVPDEVTLNIILRGWLRCLQHQSPPPQDTRQVGQGGRTISALHQPLGSDAAGTSAATEALFEAFQQFHARRLRAITMPHTQHARPLERHGDFEESAGHLYFLRAIRPTARSFLRVFRRLRDERGAERVIEWMRRERDAAVGSRDGEANLDSRTDETE